MSSGMIHEELQAGRFVEGRQIWYGIIADDVTSHDQPCNVIIPDFAPQSKIGPCFWQARDIDHVDVAVTLIGSPVSSATATATVVRTLPRRGDKCLFMWDNRRQPWVVAWWPYG